MTVKIYGIKNCSTMKKAFDWLTAEGIEFQFHDYKKEGAPEKRVRQWIKKLGWEVVINKRGTTWKKLPEAEREAMNAESAVQAALANPSLIKRPIIEQGTILLAGFDSAQWQQSLKAANAK
ncbi:MAG: arsenate reductase [Alcanivoracaceae bacterium]|nr:arsenate reductase [Alcanivoracaceae bacterium]